MARRRKDEDPEVVHDESERWLISFADMITLLMALFMVLFSISSVNVQVRPCSARCRTFSGRILPGGAPCRVTAETQAGRGHAADHSPAVTNEIASKAKAAAAAAVEKDFELLKAGRRLAKARPGQQVTIHPRGLVIVLTDKLLFGSGSALRGAPRRREPP
jgi:chemotaxis protein MotB